MDCRRALDDVKWESAKKKQDWRPASPLFQLHNVIITLHVAYYLGESIGAVRRIAAEEVWTCVERPSRPSPVNTVAA
jgi:phosphoglycerate dehydrogenase-like enzyme